MNRQYGWTDIYVDERMDLVQKDRQTYSQPARLMDKQTDGLTDKQTTENVIM